MELAGLAAAAGQGNQQQQPQRACPRCNSNNTKFCYFNNYSLTQPRYFCKGCRRYWTHGGTLRNVPVGGSSRKSKRPRTSSTSAAAPNSPQPPPAEANSFPSASTSTSAPPVTGHNLFPFQGGVGGGGFLSSLVVGQSMSLQPPVLQGRHDFAPFGRQDLPGGWHQSFIGAGGHGNAPPAATGAQFWTLGGSVGGGTSSGNGGADEQGCGSNPNQWRNFPAVTGGGDDDN